VEVTTQAGAGHAGCRTRQGRDWNRDHPLGPASPQGAPHRPFCVWLFKSFEEIFFFEHERRNGFQVEGGLRGGKMNVNRNYYEMQLEGHPLAPAEVDVTNRQLDRFRELVRRGKGRRDFDDDCSYEVRARSAGADVHATANGDNTPLLLARSRPAACARACSHTCAPSCARLRAWLTAFSRLQGSFSGGELNGHGVYTFNDGSTYDGMHALVCGCSACVALRRADGTLCSWFAK